MRVPEKRQELLGYRVGRNYRNDTGRAYIDQRAPVRGEPPQHLPQGHRVGASAVRTTGRRRDRRTLQPSDARLGELLPLRPGCSGLCVCADRRAGDEVAAPVAVPEAQGEVGEVHALHGRAPMPVDGPHAPDAADSELCVGEGMISNESRVREIRTFGSMSGERKRGQGG